MVIEFRKNIWLKSVITVSCTLDLQGDGQGIISSNLKKKVPLLVMDWCILRSLLWLYINWFSAGFQDEELNNISWFLAGFWIAKK